LGDCTGESPNHPITQYTLFKTNVIPYTQHVKSTIFPEAAILLLATLTRCWRLNYHSIWFDEAVTLQWATSEVSWIWQKTFPLIEDKHPPFYYLSLHGWLQLLQPLGLAQNDGALRLFGSLLGVLTVWGIMLLAGRLSGRTTALLTGLLTALSPVLVWYSQELRMFQPATTALVWAAYGLVRAWDGATLRTRIGWWLLLVFACTAALYSYLFSAFLLPAAGLTLLGLLLIDKQDTAQRTNPVTLTIRNSQFAIRKFLEGVVSLAVITAIFLPLAQNAWGVNQNEGTPGQAFANFLPNLWHLLQVFTIWRVAWANPWQTAGLVFYSALFLLGLLVLLVPTLRVGMPRRRSASDNRQLGTQSGVNPVPMRSIPPLAPLWIALPLLIGNLLLSRTDSIFAEDRYFLFLAPFVLWLVAGGIVTLGQWQPWLGWSSGLVATLLLLLALPPLWTPTHYRENWRAAVQEIAAYHTASPGLSSAVVAHVDYTRRPVEWYLRPHFSKAELPLFYPFGGRLTADQAEGVITPPLQGLVDQGVATIWLTQSHLDGVDDERLVERWLSDRFPLITEVYPTGIKVSGYAVQSHFSQLPALSAGAQLLAAELVPGLQLAACEGLTPQLAAQDEVLHPPSGWVHVRLWWQAVGPIGDDYVASAQIVGPEGVWGERLYRTNEALRRWPTRAWQPGVIIRDEIDINLNPVTPSREYPIVIGLLDGAGQPVGQKVECGRVIIE
jgi:uncharacterized membrane protein